MLKNYFKIALRNFAKSKLYSFINIFGLSVGIACCILLLLFVRHEWSFDNFHEKSDRLFRVIVSENYVKNGLREMSYMPLPAGRTLAAEYPEVTAYARFLEWDAVIENQGNTHRENIRFTDAAFFEMFSFPLLQGNSEQVFASPNSIVITPTLAKKYFGEDDPLGELVQIDFGLGEIQSYQVTGIIAPPPANSSITYTALMPIPTYPYFERKRDHWTNFNGSTIVLLNDNVNQTTLAEKMPAFVRTHWGEFIDKQVSRGQFVDEAAPMKLRFQPIRDIHLDTDVAFSSEPVSNPRYSYILGGIAFLVLLIASINFTTLAIGRSADRAREVGMRKVLGAVRRQLIAQFWGESLLLCLIALVLGIGLAELLLPIFNELAETQLLIDYQVQGMAILFLGAILLLTGLIAGGYPALFLSRFQAITVLKQQTSSGGSMKNRVIKGLVVLQFSLSIFLIVCTILMAEQLRFINNKSLGFDTAQVVVIPTQSESRGEDLMNLLRNSLGESPEVLSVSGTSSSFNRGWSYNGFKHEGKEYASFVYKVDPDYLQTLDIELIEGRDFRKDAPAEQTDAVIVNEAFLKELGWELPAVGKQLTGWPDDDNAHGPAVVGVVKDYHFRSLHHEIMPMMLILDSEWPISHILVKLQSENLQESIATLASTWQTIAPDLPFEFSFLSADIDSQYRLEARWSKIVGYSASLAILLGSLGLFGLVTLSTKNRTKEIGIRKVLGAPIVSILRLISGDFLKLVTLANIAAWPAAAFAMNAWLSGFVYRIDIAWWPFLLAAFIALFIALSAIFWQALRAAMANPVNSLRYE